MATLEQRDRKAIAGRIQETITAFRGGCTNSAFAKVLGEQGFLSSSAARKWVPPPAFWTWKSDEERWTPRARTKAQQAADWDDVAIPGAWELRHFCNLTGVSADFILFGARQRHDACGHCGRSSFHSELQAEIERRVFQTGVAARPDEELEVEAALSIIAERVAAEIAALRLHRSRFALLRQVAQEHPETRIPLADWMRKEAPQTTLIRPFLPGLDGTMMESNS